MDSRQVPLWLFDHIQRVIGEMSRLARTGERVTPEMLEDWHGLLCAVKYISARELTPEEIQATAAILSTPTENGENDAEHENE